MTKTVCQETQCDTITNLTVELSALFQQKIECRGTIHDGFVYVHWCQYELIVRVCINNTVFFINTFINVSQNNIVVEILTLPWGWTLHVESRDALALTNQIIVASIVGIT